MAANSAASAMMTRRPSREATVAAISCVAGPAPTTTRQPAPARRTATGWRTSPSAKTNASACRALFGHHGSIAFHGECGSAAARAAASALATSASVSASAAASRIAVDGGDGGGNSASWWRAMRPVSSAAVAKASCAITRRRKARWWRNRRSRIPPAPRRAAAAPSAILAVHHQLGDHRIVVRRDLVAAAHPGVDAHAGVRRRGAQVDEGPDRRQEAALGILGVDARLDRMAVDGEPVLRRAAARSPAATRSCHSTRSRPVIISVTGCSTCSRVFISMK